MIATPRLGNADAEVPLALPSEVQCWWSRSQLRASTRGAGAFSVSGGVVATRSRVVTMSSSVFVVLVRGTYPAVVAATAVKVPPTVVADHRDRNLPVGDGTCPAQNPSATAGVADRVKGRAVYTCPESLNLGNFCRGGATTSPCREPAVPGVRDQHRRPFYSVAAKRRSTGAKNAPTPMFNVAQTSKMRSS